MSTVIPARAYATVTGTAATFVTLDGHTEPVTPIPGEDIRHAVVRRATDEARRTGTPVELVTSGDKGEHRLLIAADGTPTTLTPASSAEGELRRGHRTDLQERETRGEEVSETAPQPDQSTRPDTTAAEPPSRPTFLTPTPAHAVTAAGWRGVLARAGISIPPSKAQQARAEWTGVVSRQWAGCRTIAVANGKGGVGKTMTTTMLAAVYARCGGGNVLAWDNNDTRGTLGWRTEQGLYDTTLRDLLPAAPGLLQAGAGVSDITRFVHHQAADRYDVLRSNPELLATDQRIHGDEFDLLMQVAARYYRLVIFDSGNDESAPRWLRMIDATTQLVIPTLANPESAESAALLLDALRNRDEHSARLADNAVVIVTQAEAGTTAAARRIVDGFTSHVRGVVTIPFDPALKAGPLRYDALRPATRDAWLHAAATTAEQL